MEECQRFVEIQDLFEIVGEQRELQWPIKI